MARTLLAIHPLSTRCHDEMSRGAVAVRAHWQRVFDHLDPVSPEEMPRCQDFSDISPLRGIILGSAEPEVAVVSLDEKDIAPARLAAGALAR